MKAYKEKMAEWKEKMIAEGLEQVLQADKGGKVPLIASNILARMIKYYSSG